MAITPHTPLIAPYLVDITVGTAFEYTFEVSDLSGSCYGPEGPYDFDIFDAEIAGWTDCDFATIGDSVTIKQLLYNSEATLIETIEVTIPFPTPTVDETTNLATFEIMSFVVLWIVVFNFMYKFVKNDILQ